MKCSGKNCNKEVEDWPNDLIKPFFSDYCLGCRLERVVNYIWDAAEAGRENITVWRGTFPKVVNQPYLSDERVQARWELYNRRCWICGKTAHHTDHVKPRVAGGADLPCNFRPACQRCNSKKSGRWPFPLDSKSAYDTLYTT